MKKSILVVSVLLLLCTMPTFATTTTTSLSASVYGIASFDTSMGIGYYAPGVTFRSVTCPRDVGYYYGFELTAGYLFGGYMWTWQPFEIIAGSATGALGDMRFQGSLRMPFGYRFAAAGRGAGFYLGLGPEIDFWMLTNNVFTAGGFLELGWQTNKTEGIGIHFGLQLAYTPVMYEIGGDFSVNLWEPTTVQPGIQIGVSWRKTKGDEADGN